MGPFDKYLVWRCIHCGTWQGRRNNNYKLGMSELSRLHAISKITLGCISCGKKIKFKDKKNWGSRVKHYWFNHPGEATQKIKELKIKGKPVETSF